MIFPVPVRIAETACIGSSLEKEGPLGDYLDGCVKDGISGEETWEKRESENIAETVKRLLEKGKKTECEIDLMMGGDLMNQCTGCAYGAEDFDVPYFGLYGACSTFVQGMITGSAFISAGLCKTAVALASSDYCTAERQYRFPLSYGSFPKATSQHTVTGCGGVLLERDTAEKHGVFVTSALPGIVIDRGITNAANMGAAMSTAAVDTLLRYLSSSKTQISDYDVIATGDLGKIGLEMVLKMLKDHGYDDKSGVITDCGVEIYDLEKQDVLCGGSGCGCSAITFCGYFYDRLKKGELQRMLLVGTGAMMSPQSLLQGLSIPAVAHLIEVQVIK